MKPHTNETYNEKTLRILNNQHLKITNLYGEQSVFNFVFVFSQLGKNRHSLSSLGHFIWSPNIKHPLEGTEARTKVTKECQVKTMKHRLTLSFSYYSPCF